jgi:hypothetical protein
MSSISAPKLLFMVLLSSALSVGSTVTLMRYTPELVAMPLPEPDIQLKSHVVPTQLVCEAHTDWQDVEELSTSFSLRRDSTVLVMLSTWVSFDYQINDPDARAFVRINAYVDDTRAEPHEVCLTYMSETAGMGQTMLFHVAGLKQGTHNLRFQWQNQGAAGGLLRSTVVEIIMIPARNVI